ncbi:MAG: cobaltochelatase subunit CobN [Chloroherpetonaceae bacterium]|nr:cobaltochelatase subunit CobN [Chloroherpetonaceae bacterium]
MNSLADNSHELDALVKALNGEYLPSGPGGDLIRDGLNVLPTGRNIHAIDPWRIPSELAFAKGAQIAEAIIAQHLEEHGTYPETIAEVLWGLDTIKTKGEAVATVIRLIGARPAYDGQNKISHYELIPLEELGRPRIDVLMHLSPVFRNTFGILMNHLNTLIKTAAAANEPEEMNFIKKHVSAALRQGLSFESATARLFTQAPGMYGTYVDDMIEDSAWESDNDLDALFIRRNAFTYGGARNGKKETEALEQLLGTVSRVVHQVDSVEFGISDIDHYFSTSGALKLCAEKRNPTVKAVKLNYVESFTADVKIDEVAKALRVEYRTKLLNPKWYEGMLAHGHSGAAEISNRMTYMLGWDATTKSVNDWVYQKAAEIFALDETMRERLTRLNPQAMKNIVSRLLEASGRGLWQADTETLNKLRELYADLEDRLEGIVN